MINNGTGLNIHKYMRETSKAVMEKGIIPYLEEYSHPNKTIKESNSHLPLLRGFEKKSKERHGKLRTKSQLISSYGRALFSCLSTREDWKKIIPFLTANELILTSTYLIDDIVDRQDKRFGDNSTWKKYGINETIFAGIRQREIAERIIIDKQECSLENKIDLLSLISDISRKTYEGQTLNEKLIGNYNEEVYLERCEYFGGIFWGGISNGISILSNTSEFQKNNIEKLATNYGIALMIRNDLKDFITQKEIFLIQTSKSLKRTPLEDIRIGRITYPLYIALQDEKISKKLGQFLGKQTLSPDEETLIISLISETQAFDKTNELIEKYKNKALEFCKELPENESKNKIISLISLMDNSKHYVELMKNAK